MNLRAASLGHGGRRALGRQPAEGGPGQVAPDRPPAAALGRADPRRRRRREARNLRADEPVDCAGHRHSPDYFGNARTAGHERPDRGDAPRPGHVAAFARAGHGRPGARGGHGQDRWRISRREHLGAVRESRTIAASAGQPRRPGAGRPGAGARPGRGFQRRRGVLQAGHPPRHAPPVLGLRHPRLRHDAGDHHRRHRPVRGQRAGPGGGLRSR